MRPAPEPLVRCNMTASCKTQTQEIMRHTGERMWQVLARLVAAEWRRLFHPTEEGLAGEQEA